MHNKNDTMKKIEKIMMEEVEPQKEVDDKILGKPRKPLSPEQKKRKADYDKGYMNEHYKRYAIMFRYTSDKQYIDYLSERKRNGNSPADVFRELIRKELNK